MPGSIGPTPEFDREAAAVMNAPYWSDFSAISDDEAEADRAAYARLVMARLAEKDTLADAISNCQTYDDLPPEAKAIYDRAKASLKRDDSAPTV